MIVILQELQYKYGKCGYVGYGRTLYLNIVPIPRLEKLLFEVNDDQYDKTRKSYEVTHISTNKKNDNLKNLKLELYSNVTSDTRRSECFNYKYRNVNTNSLSTEFSGVMELVDDIILNNIFGDKYTPQELDNLIYTCLQDNKYVDNTLEIIKYESESKKKMIKRRKNNMRLWLITDIQHNDMRGFMEADKAWEFVASILGIMVSSAGRFVRNVTNTKEHCDVLKRHGVDMVRIQLKVADEITEDEILLYGDDKDRNNIPKLRQGGI